MAQLPEDFDWRFYCHYYSDLKLAGIDTDKKSIDHYLKHGHHERRIYHSKMIRPSEPTTDNYSDFDDHKSFFGVSQRIQDLLVDRAGLKPHHQVLEVGCGIGKLTGSIIQYLSQGHGRYYGLDTDVNAIEWCRSSHPKGHFDLMVRHHDEQDPTQLAKVTIPHE